MLARKTIRLNGNSKRSVMLSAMVTAQDDRALMGRLIDIYKKHLTTAVLKKALAEEIEISQWLKG